MRPTSSMAVKRPNKFDPWDTLKSIPPTLKYEPGMIVAEGDLVIVHGRFSSFGAPMNWIAADIVHIQNGILVEHWDIIQDEATEEQSISKAHVRNYIPDLRLKKSKCRRWVSNDYRPESRRPLHPTEELFAKRSGCDFAFRG